MALNDILKSIATDTETEIKKLEKAGKEKANKVKAEFKEKLEQEKQRLLKEIQVEADRKVSQASFQVQSLAKNKILQKKQALLEEIYAEVLKELTNLDEKDYQKLLTKLVKELPSLPEGQIKATTKDKEVLAKVKTEYKISSETIKAKGGFIFEAKGLVIDNTLEALVKRLQDETETTVAKIIF